MNHRSLGKMAQISPSLTISEYSSLKSRVVEFYSQQCPTRLEGISLTRTRGYSGLEPKKKNYELYTCLLPI